MLKILSIFNSKSVPRALIWLLPAIVLTEVSVYRWFPDHLMVSPFVDEAIAVNSQIARTPFDRDIVMLSDSVATSVMKENIPESASIANLGANGAIEEPGRFFFLRRYLERNRPPLAVVLILRVPFLWNLDGPGGRTWFQRSFLRSQEILEISRYKGPIFGLQMLGYKFLPSLRARLSIQQGLLGSLGAFPNRDGTEPPSESSHSFLDLFQNKVFLEGIYLRKMAALLRSHGSELHFVLSAITATDYAKMAQPPSGAWNEPYTLSTEGLHKLLDPIQTEYPNVYVHISDQFLFPDDWFRGIHLDEAHWGVFRSKLLSQIGTIQHAALLRKAAGTLPAPNRSGF